MGESPTEPEVTDVTDDAPSLFRIGMVVESSPAPKKRRKSTSPTARTLAECRKRGWVAQVVEKFVRFPAPGHRVDLFGVIDIIAIDGDHDRPQIVGIQASPGSVHAAHRDKILAESRIHGWIAAGARLELWSWSQRGAAGKRKLWTLRVETYAEMVAGASC